MKLFRKIISIITAMTISLGLSVSVFSQGTDNSGYLKYIKSADAGVRLSYREGLIETPEWVDSLIIVEVRPDTASIGGTFAECYDLLDYYAELGVNGIWLAPVYDRAADGNGYSNLGPHTIEPKLTGKDNYEEGWKELAKFVSHAHSKGIYVFLDVITWGVIRGAPLISEHPDWFNGEAWGNIAFDWTNRELYDWYVDTLVNNILVTDADGFRCDCEPYHSGYDMYGDVRRILNEKGKKIVVICEDSSEGRGTYDFDQEGLFDYSKTSRGEVYVNPVNFFGDGMLNIVDCAKKGYATDYGKWQSNPLRRGRARYYTNCITNHDFQSRDVLGSRINIGYAAILAPYIPIWYMGDEFNAFNEHGVLYDLPVDFSGRFNEGNAGFLEDVGRMISIRRQYADIFEYWPSSHRHTNICKVKADGFGTLQPYARYAGNRAVLVVPNNGKETASGKITVPFSACGIGLYGKYSVTDLMTGNVIASGTRKEISSFTAEIGADYVGIYLVEGEEPLNEALISAIHFVRELPETIHSGWLEFISAF